MTSKRMIEQRKNIIKDVVKQLNTKRLIADRGRYLTPGVDENDYCAQFGDGNYDVAYKTPKKSCTVCALGAIFVTSVDRYNKLKVEDAQNVGTGKSMIKHLSKWWSDFELGIIEAAFEGKAITGPNGDNYELLLEDEPKYWSPDEEFMAKVDKAIGWHSKRTNKYYDTRASLRTSSTEDEYILREICKKLLNHPECLFRA